ncbi:hypothetical protein HYPSUDRAFT_60581 [Hypholoma sublateritium FD-334 SS-4]|uniref:Uncharacterized protein n=1 Tax=Hypholoma sublateritium (strain FD-334 SS-4) TaxID=945553 RepID=A0A0D2QDS4_HYPSF|nr:hypothetical protein HYPSUDRAFT_60581 [Hypholoma sublateritium FD-334 SS-4]
MPGTNNEQILGQVQFVLLDLAMAVEKNGISDQNDLARSLFTAGRTFYDTSTEWCLRPSEYSSDPVSRSQPIRIVFQDISSKDAPSYTKHADFRTWKTFSLEANPDEPMHSLLLRFAVQANIEHKHPYFPILEFDFQIVRSSSTNGHTKTLHSGRRWFTQGSVRDVLLGSELLLYNRHDAPDDFKETKPPLRMPFPYQRQYPASNPQPPAHWIATPKVEGPWKEIMSLQLIGDGAELTAHSTYHPLIAKTMFIPADFSVITTKGLMLKRLRVPPEHLGTKFTFPLTLDQARSLLGRTVYYQCVDDENQPVRRSKAAAKLAKVKAEDPIYIAYVWGLDPDARLLKTMEHANEDSGELCRTFQFDASGAPLPVEFESASLSNGYPPLRKVAQFDWIGLVELPLPTGPSKEQIAAEEALNRKRKRFASILAAAPRLFEVGIDGDCSFVVGELNLRPPGAAGTVTVENCKAGIWESGYAERDDGDDGEFLIWSDGYGMGPST